MSDSMRMPFLARNIHVTESTDPTLVGISGQVIEETRRTIVVQTSNGNKILAKDVINKFVKNNKKEVSIEYIQKVVSDYFQMDIQTLQSKTRKRHIVQARQIAMYFAKKFTKASLASIGSQIGRRDHATVLHACKTVDNLSFTDKQFRTYVEDLNQKLSN